MCGEISVSSEAVVVMVCGSSVPFYRFNVFFFPLGFALGRIFNGHCYGTMIARRRFKQAGLV